MELNVTEFDSDSNKKHVTFEYEDEDEYDENIEDIGSIDENSNFSPAPSQESLPNVGRFQTINRQKPVFNPPPPPDHEHDWYQCCTHPAHQVGMARHAIGLGCCRPGQV